MFIKIVLNNETIFFQILNLYLIIFFILYLEKKKKNIILVFWTKLQVIRYQRIKIMFCVMF